MLVDQVIVDASPSSSRTIISLLLSACCVVCCVVRMHLATSTALALTSRRETQGAGRAWCGARGEEGRGGLVVSGMKAGPLCSYEEKTHQTITTHIHSLIPPPHIPHQYRTTEIHGRAGPLEPAGNAHAQRPAPQEAEGK